MIPEESVLEFLQESLQRNERWITLADTKAGAVLVLVPALAALCGETIATYTRQRLEPILAAENSVTTPFSLGYGAIVLAAVVFAVLALHSAYRALLPRLSSRHKSPFGVVYFKHVARRSADAWAKDIAALSRNQLLQDFEEQVYVTSQICDEKFDNVGDCIRNGARFFAALAVAYAITLLF